MEIEENGACISLNTFDGVLEYKRKTENRIAHLEIALKEEKEKMEKFNKYMCYNVIQFKATGSLPLWVYCSLIVFWISDSLPSKVKRLKH